jgi:hemolysin III
MEEEIANAITHGIGVLLAVAGTILLLVKASVSAPSADKGFYLTAFSIFGFSMIFLYLTSTLYHSLLKTKAYTVFERLDHSAIYILIAGTYTGYCLTALRGPVGWAIFGVIWGLTAAGISLYAVFGKNFESYLYSPIFSWAGLLFLPRSLSRRLSRNSAGNSCSGAE